MSNHYQILVDSKLNHLSDCRFIESKKRWEATANGIKNIGYGNSTEEAMEMLRKIVENQVRGRPELENIDDHEANKSAAGGRSIPQSVTNVFNNVQGMVITGSVENMHNVSVSVHQSIANLQATDESLASRLNEFVTAVEASTELPEPAKVEVLDRADVIAVEAAKPKEKRLTHRILDNVKGIADTLKGCAALKTIWDVAEPVVRAHLGL